MNDTGKITTVMEPDDENRGKALVPQRFQPPSVPSEPGELSVGDLVAQVRKVQEVMDAVMKRDFHYGVIPGCGDKPTLFKPGAEKLALVFRLCPSFDVTETDLGNGHRHFRVTCVLTHITTGAKIAEGVGYGSTMESKYRWRQGQRKCPKCGKPAIIKGKQEYGGGWLCWPKKDGCNAKWPDGAKEIEGQSVDRVENPDVADVYNTVLKMAKKRAQIDATLTATGASDIFAQDLEDLAEAAATAAKPPVAERPTEDPHEVIEDAFEQQAPPPQASQPRPRGTAKQRDGFMERMKAAKSYDELQPIYGEFAKPFRWSKEDGMKLHDYYEHRVAEFKAVAEPGAQG